MSKGLLLVTMEPPAALEEEFNDWYDTEHFPQRRALPGFESAARYVCLFGFPRWLALYDLASPAILETDAYRAVSGPNSTPWSRRILPRTIGRMRIVAEQIAPGDALLLPAPNVSCLILAGFAAGAEAADDIACKLACLQGVLQQRLFVSAAPDRPRLWAIAELARPVDTQSAFDALAGRASPRLINIYAPYFRE